MKVEIINLDAEEKEEKLVLVDIRVIVHGQRLYFESTGDRSRDKRAKSHVINMANKYTAPFCPSDNRR